MDWTAGALPFVWAQAAASTTANPSALAPLALRRWCASQTLSSPESLPSLFGLWVWLAALGSLLALALVFQGPGRALRQLLDVPGHALLVAASTRRLRKAARAVAALVGLTVLSWTGSQSFAYNKSEGRDDVLKLTRARHLAELAFEQGVLAALTPLRDVTSLGANRPLLIIATLLLFRASTDIRGKSSDPAGGVDGPRHRPSGWANASWVCGALLTLYRLASIGTGSGDLPLGGCLMIEPLVIPALMAFSDGLLLAWVLAELRDAGFDNPVATEVYDTRPAVDLIPASAVACLAALPARYLATALVLITEYYLPSSAVFTPVGTYFRWQLGLGLAVVQGVALVFAGSAGAVAWGDGGVAGAVRGYGRMLASHGARLVVVFGLSGLAAGAVSAVAYVVVLSLPAAPWVLNAADSYAHYGTLPVGLWALSALVELGERSLPEATSAPEDGSASPPAG